VSRFSSLFAWQACYWFWRRNGDKETETSIEKGGSADGELLATIGTLTLMLAKGGV
jgi:hypothetical protein